MQQIWGKILSREVVQPGSFSPRTLSVVRDLVKNDANLFASLCEYVWSIPEVGFVPVVPGNFRFAERREGISHDDLMHLNSIGLIAYEGIATFTREDRIKQVKVDYFGSVHELRREHESELLIGTALFTAVGQELRRIVRAVGDNDIRTRALNYWEHEGWTEVADQSAPGTGT